MSERINHIPDQIELKNNVHEAVRAAEDAYYAAHGNNDLYFRHVHGKGNGRRITELAGDITGDERIKTSQHHRRIDTLVKRNRGDEEVSARAYTYEASGYEKRHELDDDRASTTLRRYDSEGNLVKKLESDNPLVARLVGSIAAEGVKKQARESLDKPREQKAA